MSRASPRKQAAGWLPCILPLLACAGAQAADAEAPRSALERALIDEARLTIHVRSYLMDRYEDGGEGPAAWAAGGWIGYETGWFADPLKLGLVGYTSQPLWAPEDRDGTSLLLPGQEGYSVPGQAYATLKVAGQELTLYRQLVDEPEVNPQDSRMTPNTFEGGVFYGKAGPLDLHAGLLTAMKPRNADHFVNIAGAAGVGENENMYLASIALPDAHGFSARASVYAVPDVLASSYAEASAVLPLAEEAKLRLSGQFMFQSGIGEELLTGPDFTAWVGGVRAGFDWRGLGLTAGYTVNGSDDQWQAPYGSWPGYTHMILKDFNRPGEQALLLGASLDLSEAGLEGLSISAAAARDLDAGADAEDRAEYDFTAGYRLAAMAPRAPWLAPLHLRLRYALLDSGGSETTDFRAILNYEWTPEKNDAAGD